MLVLNGTIISGSSSVKDKIYAKPSICEFFDVVK